MGKQPTLSGLLEDALGTLENALGSLEVGDTVDELLKGRLEDARDTLQEVVNRVGEQAQEGGGLRSLHHTPHTHARKYDARCRRT